MILYRLSLMALGPALVVASRYASLIQNAPSGISFTIPQKSDSRSAWNKFVRPHQRSVIHVQDIHGFRGHGGKKTNAKSAAAILGAHQRTAGGTGYENITTTTAYGTQYATKVHWSGRPMYLLLDTGSSDT